MRVTRVTRGYRPRTDGWSRHATRLSEIQAALGHDVLVLQPEQPSRRNGRLEELRVAGSTVNRGGTWGVMYFGLASALALLILNRRRRGDVIHVHGDALEIAAATLTGRLLGLPTIATVHAPPSARPPHWQVLRQAVPFVRGFIAVSPMIRDELVRAGAPAGSILVQSSGVDLARLARAPEGRERERARLGRRSDDFIVLFAGRLERAKGLDTLLKALAVLPDEVHALIAGGGTLRRELERVPHARRAHFLGAVSHEEIESLLGAADVLAVPSVDLGGTTEGTPTVILEAFAAGLPVIGSRAGGIPTVLEDERTGLLVPQRDAAALAAAILRLRNDQLLRSRIADAALATVQRQDWRLVAERITSFTAAMLEHAR